MINKFSNRIILRTITPVLLTIILFVITIQFIVMPAITKNMMASKKEMIKELVNITHGILTDYYKRELSGELTQEEAQKQAVDKIRNLRYGPSSDDYFWIFDLNYNMIMHPVFSELENQDSLIFIDSEGKDLIKEFKELILEKGSGYVDYMWLSKNDTSKIVHKLSYIKGFRYWDWVISTGIYIEDVKLEAGVIKRKLYVAIAGFFVLLLLVSFYIIITGQRIERKKNIAEKELKNSESRYRNLFNSAGDAIFLMDGERIIDCNKKTLELFKCRKEDILGKTPINFSPLIQPNNMESGKLAMEKINQVLKGESQFFEWKHKKLSGVLFDAEISLSLAELSEGIYIQAIIRDVTDRKIVEEKLSDSEKQFKAIFDNSLIGIYQTTPEGVIKIANPALVKMLGYSSLEELNQRNLENKVHYEIESARKVFKERIEKEGRIIGLESKWKKKDGSTLYIRENAQLVFDENKNILYYEGTVENITAQKNAEKELIASNEELKATSDALKESNTELTIALEEARKGKELKLANEKLQRNEKILIQAHKSVKQKQSELEELNFELKESHEETQQLNEELSATNEHLFLQKEELETALERLKEMQSHLVQSEKMASVGVLTSGIAHEINNPLNFIQGGKLALENYIEENLKDHTESLNPLLKIIDTGIYRASDIVKSLNRFNRKSEANTEKCDIHSLIDNCLVMIQNQLKHKVEIKKDYTRKEFTTLGNEGKLHQVFINILINAEQAIEEKGYIKISTSIDQGKLEIKIKDNGCGISKENLPQITDPFFTTKDPGKGTGLGLSITYQIIKEHNGDLKYKSKQGEGTTAIITLPLQN